MYKKRLYHLNRIAVNLLGLIDNGLTKEQSSHIASKVKYGKTKRTNTISDK